MATLLDTIKHALSENPDKPFSVYTSVEEQKLLNVPITKPLLIVVLSGSKELAISSEFICHSGSFIFLSDSPTTHMRNIPKNKEYFALLIEFDYEDFKGLQINTPKKQDYLIGTVTPTLEQCLQQFIQSASWAPQAILSSRKREIISLLIHMGHQDITSLLSPPKISEQLHDIFIRQGFSDLTLEPICKQLAMSESTLRRKLKSEGTSVQDVKDQARLGLALHMLQTTQDAIGVVAGKCGYQSQSRFTDRFKKRFGLTPSELRRTQMRE